MTTIFKSNVKASQFISDIAGIVNPNYVFSADFVNQIYTEDGSAVAFDDVISYKKTTDSYDIINNKLTNLGVDKPLFNNPKTGDGGLWRNRSNTASILGSEQVKTSKSLPKLAGWSGKFLLLQVWGKGTVKISGAIEVQATFGDTASQSKYVIAKVSSTLTTDVVFTVAGEVDYYQAIMGTTDIKSLARYFKPLPVATAQSLIKAQQTVIDRLNTAAAGFTIILRHSLPKNNVGSGKIVGVFELASQNSSASYFTSTADALSLRFNNTTAGVSYAKPDLLYSDGQNFTTVLVCNKSTLVAYREGAVIGTLSIGADIWQHLTLGHTVSYTGGGVTTDFEGMFKNLVIYDYPASADEAIELTKSFTW